MATSFLHIVQLLVAIQLLFEVSRKADCYIDTIPVFNIKKRVDKEMDSILSYIFCV